MEKDGKSPAVEIILVIWGKIAYNGQRAPNPLPGRGRLCIIGAAFRPLGGAMEKDVVISIRGMQKYENADPDVIELVTAGRLARDGERYTLTYQESELTGLDGTQTAIQVEGEQVIMTRSGEFNTQMVFQEGRRHLSMYNTPYGAMAIGVNTRHLLARMDDQGGSIEVDYTIEVDHALAGRSVFQIQVREAGGSSLKQ
jgi:Uncharacterized protein conserved in bacteria